MLIRQTFRLGLYIHSFFEHLVIQTNRLLLFCLKKMQLSSHHLCQIPFKKLTFVYPHLHLISSSCSIKLGAANHNNYVSLLASFPFLHFNFSFTYQHSFPPAQSQVPSILSSSVPIYFYCVKIDSSCYKPSEDRALLLSIYSMRKGRRSWA